MTTDKILKSSKKIVSTARDALDSIDKLIESEEYLKLVSILSDHVKTKSFSSRIVITGVGKNANIATKISETMASLGIPSFYLNSSHAPHGDFGFISPTDFIIHISRSGTTEELLVAMGYIKSIFPSIKQALIHCNAKKETKSPADFELFIPGVVEGDEHSLAPTTSTTAILCVLDAMAASISSLSNFKRIDFLKFHPAGALGKMLKEENNEK